MSNRVRPTATLRRNRVTDSSRWLVPAAIGVLGLVTVVLILFAFGVLIGLIHF